jgi:hypothetical protein
MIALFVGGTMLCASAQSFPPPGGSISARDQICNRLEAQLSAVDRGSSDPNRADQIRRYEEAVSRQQSELDRTVAHSRRQGCEGSGFFQLFGGGRSEQCGPLNNQIQEMRGNLNRILADLQRLQGGGAGERDGQRRAVLAALSQNDCGPQYRTAATAPQQRGLFETLFGTNSVFSPESGQQGSGYRTICVRTCDGYYFPISFSTSSDRFRDDERTCQRMCPASEVILFSHRNPGEEVAKAVSIGGRLYSELPNAFAYRKEFNSACSCKRPGETWADALKHLDDRQTILERGDILVTEERAKTLSQPRDAKGRPIRGAATQPASVQAPAPAAEKVEADPTGPDTAKKPVRAVGPLFVPVR